MAVELKNPGRIIRPNLDAERLQNFIATGAVAAAFLFLYRRVAVTLVQQWLSSDMYSYGFFIPGISFYLVWVKRKGLQKKVIVPGYGIGAVLLILALAILLTGSAGNIMIMQELSLPIMLAGIISFIMGRAFLKIFWLPVAYLLFMIPIWGALTEPLIPFYQRLSAVIAALTINVMGIPVHRNGVFIDLPHVKLEVAEACSGVRYILSVFAIAIPLSYLFIKNWFRRAALICGGIGIATVFNGLRIGLIGILTYYGIFTVVHGPGHILHGLSVSAAGFAALFGGVRLLSEKNSSDPTSAPAGNWAPREDRPSRQRNKAGTFRFWLIALLLVSASFFQMKTASPVPLKKSFDVFPNRINQWIETREEVLFEAHNYIHPDALLSRTYVSPEYSKVSLFIGYFERQEQNRKLVDYRTAELERGAQTNSIVFDQNETKRVKTTIATINGKKTLLLYWHQIADDVIPDRRWASFKTAINSLIHGRQNGAFVVLAQTLANAANAEQAIKNCSALARDIAPVIGQFVP